MSLAQISTKGIGTKKVGYAGPEYGPFRCGNCVWFSFVKNGGRCQQPEVIEDPEVPKDPKSNLAIVHQDGCCNEFKPARKLEDVKFGDVGL